MKHFIVSLSLLFLTTLSFAPAAGAASIFDPACKGANSSATACQGRADTGKNPFYGPDGVATKIVDILAFIIGIASVIVIVVGGINYMLSTGDPGKINNAKNTILYAVIGIAVALTAKSIVIFVLSKL